MMMYMLIEQSNNYSKSSGILWQYYRDLLGVADNPVKTDFESFKSNVKIIKKPPNNGNTKKDLEIAVPIKYLSNFWRNVEMPLIYCGINLTLTWSTNCVISHSTGAGTFAIIDTKLYLPVITLSNSLMQNYCKN